MNILKTGSIFLFLILLGFILFMLALYDVFFHMGWMMSIIGGFILLFLLACTFLYFSLKTPVPKVGVTIEEFEKTLKGGLFHFKCPSCGGYFAIKKSKKNNKKPTKMTCPNCGIIATIPSDPMRVEEEIPEKKSIGLNFRCVSCGEGITVWAEGAELYPHVDVYSCPFCGLDSTMKKV